MMTPIVSILMSAYNSEGEISAAIKSLLLQEFRDFELLVMNDGSNDRTGEVLEKYASTDERIIAFHQSNQGLTASLNTLINYAKGDYIARLDSDDISYPQRLIKQIDYLKKRTDVGLVSSWVHSITAQGKSITCYCYPDDNYWIKNKLESGQNPIFHSGVMIRRNVLEKLEGPYRFQMSQDLDLWLRLVNYTKFGIVPEILLAYRHHSKSLSARDTQKRFRIHDLIMDMHKRRSMNLGDNDWHTRENRIISKYSNLGIRNYNSQARRNYINGIALQMNNLSQNEARKYFVKALGSPELSLKMKAVSRLILTYLPKSMYKTILFLNYKRPRKYGPLVQYCFPIETVVSPDTIKEYEDYWQLVNTA